MWVYEASSKYCFLKAEKGPIVSSPLKTSGLALDRESMARYRREKRAEASLAMEMVEAEKLAVERELNDTRAALQACGLRLCSV